MTQSSLVMAVVLLAYAITPYIRTAETTMALPIAGINFNFQLSFATLMTLLIALLAAAGTDWIIKSHPRFVPRTQFPHVIVPAVTAWLIGLPMLNMSVNWQWWVVLGLGGLLLYFVINAEYLVYDIMDQRRYPASVGLTAISYALILFLAVAIRTTEVRLYLAVPMLFLAILVFSLRTLYLSLDGRWVWHWGIGLALVIAQLAIGLHYWRISPLKYGLVLLAPAYALLTLATGLEEGRPIRQILVEPLVMLVIIWLAAIII